MVNKNRLLILIPCYNEKENAPKIHKRITALRLKADILFVDDNSPDGTGKILDKIAKSHPHTFVLHRPGKQGIGSAHKAGINWAYQKNYKGLITMDCDFTHPPEKISLILENSRDYDVVVTSRYLRKKSLEGWNVLRKALTLFGHLLTRLLLKMPYDATNAFRFYNLEKIPQGLFSLVDSDGYSFFFESLHVLNLNKFRIKEIPINLPPRTYGSSKMRISDALQSLQTLFVVYFNTLRKNKYVVGFNYGK
jgi:dolichol-phosphate mannosyltransferase